NPPVDAIREELIMSTDTSIGPEANMLEPTPECARQIKLPSPILTNEELEKLRHLADPDNRVGDSRFKSISLPMLFEVVAGGRGLETALDELCRRASEAIAQGFGIIILSDRGATKELAPIPALLAVAGVHHHLIREGTRTQVGLIVESGEPREVHHFALLLGYGAAAINPYLVFETLHDSIRKELISVTDEHTALHNYVHAINKGIIKVISKMGISTTQGYCGAQIFEAIGLQQDLVDKYFTWTPSRIGGANLDVIAEEVRRRHAAAFVERSEQPTLESGGHYQYRKDGEPHLFNPLTVHKLQAACRTGNYSTFKEYSTLVNNHSRSTLRSVMEFRST